MPLNSLWCPLLEFMILLLMLRLIWNFPILHGSWRVPDMFRRCPEENLGTKTIVVVSLIDTIILMSLFVRSPRIRE